MDGSAFTVSYVALWLIVLLQTAILLGVVRMVARMPATPGSNPGGRAAPAFEAADSDGNRLSNQALRGRTTALVFVSSSCSACTVTFDELHALSHKARENVVLVCAGPEPDCLDVKARYGSGVRMVLDPESDLARRFQVDGVPMAVIIGEDGRIVSTGEPLRGAGAERLLALQTSGDGEA